MSIMEDKMDGAIEAGLELEKEQNAYPLSPVLSEEGQKEAQELINSFKEKLKLAADEAIGDLYCHVAHYIESDSWGNFTQQLLDGFKNYNNRKIQGKYDFDEIRKAIFKEYREELIPDLNQDLVKENKDLKDRIKWMEESERERSRY